MIHILCHGSKFPGIPGTLRANQLRYPNTRYGKRCYRILYNTTLKENCAEVWGALGRFVGVAEEQLSLSLPMISINFSAIGNYPQHEIRIHHNPKGCQSAMVTFSCL